ncbi:1-phosphofructokinase family hexose kinase [Microbacterium allomyrinae]|uniref:Bifunctional hydroxymethylpyrimidine kinase/phosphomethylpyrimidine kinase n=1 Tax=Microbacterium allomyrinae TaxID=2830666 RepID=A0A9X1LTI5_9MICO|nr:PfkB family carbohydrate kinase [Microbacterium allomyrinae]MCC2031532.1 bifunctional hydroxymethylpyrimidine kinase/phosphomethylpyrimidine kinase [Microbacterium allomyrinae]
MSLTATTVQEIAEGTATRTRVVTLTPAPAIDRVYMIDGLQAGRVNRARHIEAHVAGNGVNLARDLHASGNVVRAVVPISFEDAAALTEGDDIFRVVSVPRAIRVNTVLIGADGVTTNINQAAHELTGLDWRALRATVGYEALRIDADWIVVGGSLPAVSASDGIDPADLFGAAHLNGARLCLDSPGAVVGDWLRRGAKLDLISPNIHELEELHRAPIRTLGEAVDAARRVVDRGVGAVMVSLGHLGAVMVTPTQQLWAHTPPTRVVNTTGAGDAALAGLMAQWHGDEGSSLEQAMTRATRWGRAAVGLITPTITPNDVEDVEVRLESPLRSLSLH